MSRIGRKPIDIPSGVTVSQDGSLVVVEGAKGKLECRIMPGLSLEQDGGQLRLTKTVENMQTQSSYGLMRTLIANMTIGVSRGYERQLEINGVGYKAVLSSNSVTLSLGFSHPIHYPLPPGIAAKVEKNILTISGHDKQLVGQVAANIRAFKKPEPYKGKGIKYLEEKIRRKAGKTASKG